MSHKQKNDESNIAGVMSPAHKSTHPSRLTELVENQQGIDKLLTVMQALRDPAGGCPWDKQQDYQSIVKYTVEEVYEVVEAIENNDFESLKDELGDLLFQIIFYAQIAKEQGRFDFYQIVEAICDKLIRRHPHVFGDENYQNEEQLNQAWEAQKHQERNQKSDVCASVLDDIPKALPELKRAQKIQQRVAQLGFDWTDVAQVWQKVDEECEEVKQAAISDDDSKIEDELGDLLFSVVNLSRHYGIDAEMALRRANQKFEQRFRHVEKAAEKPLDRYTLQQLEELWLQAKKNSCKG